MEKIEKEIEIKRFKENPLIAPNKNIKWMGQNVFNCGVIIGDDGIYKMLIRGAWTNTQVGSDLGLALSTNGVKWNPLMNPVLRSGFNEHCLVGVEDPRIVKWVDGFYYIFATACCIDGGRVGIWRTKNFFDYEWVGIPLDQEDKDASIFPEPIDGWAYLLHRKTPHIWISRTKDQTLKTGWQDSHVLIEKDQTYRHPDHGVLPDKIGIAGPPIRVPKGWLLIIHVVHRYDPKITKYSFLIYRSYSLSFIVLDLKDPTKVIYNHRRPILWPEERHEVIGTVPNVVFSCATIDPGGDSLYIYWGGADTVICGGKLYKKDLPMCY